MKIKAVLFVVPDETTSWRKAREVNRQCADRVAEVLFRFPDCIVDVISINPGKVDSASITPCVVAESGYSLLADLAKELSPVDSAFAGLG